MAADGSARRALGIVPPPGVADAEPAWSPDARRLAFTRILPLRTEEDFDRSQVHVAEADGTGVRAVTPLRARTVDQTPAWSPDGRRLAFARFRGGTSRIATWIAVVDADGGGERTLVTQRLDERWRSVGQPAWSPDGRLIAFTRTSLGRGARFRHSIEVVEAEGGRPRTLVRDARSPAWSPDGSRIAFASVRDRNGTQCGSDQCTYNGEIYVASADGTNPVRLTRNEGDDDEPDWSADGARIAFSSDRNFPDGETPEVYSVAPDGSCLTWLTNGSPGSGSPDWRPAPPGSSDPRGCGAVGRPALVDIDFSRAAAPRDHPVFWLGRDFENLLVSDVRARRAGVFFHYADCGAFQPRDCPVAIQLETESVCQAGGILPEYLAQARLARVRGALVGFFPADGGAFALTGGASVRINFEGRLVDRRAASRAREVVRGLRPVGQDAPPSQSLPPPMLPRSLVRDVRRTVRLHRRLGSVRAVARRLKASRYEVTGRLELARTLRRFGRIATARC